MKDCKCGKPLGSNKDCQACLDYMIKVGAQDVNEEKAKNAIAATTEWLKTKGAALPGQLFQQVKLLLELLKDFYKGVYKDVPWASIAAIVFAILYAVNPIDLVPDFIPVVGFLDDIGVVGAVISSFRSDLRDYCKFKGYDTEEYGL
jgi:uncharacterized membrane protein YkvA (DUF1232 family)